MQGAWCGTWCRVSRIRSWAEGNGKPFSHPGCPNPRILEHTISVGWTRLFFVGPSCLVSPGVWVDPPPSGMGIQVGVVRPPSMVFTLSSKNLVAGYFYFTTVIRYDLYLTQCQWSSHTLICSYHSQESKVEHITCCSSFKPSRNSRHYMAQKWEDLWHKCKYRDCFKSPHQSWAGLPTSSMAYYPWHYPALRSVSPHGIFELEDTWRGNVLTCTHNNYHSG